MYLCNISSPKPPYGAQIGGRFIFAVLIMIPYPKHYKSPEQLVTLLKKRGLIIQDERKAESYIRNVGFYRLSAYLYPLLDSPKEQQIFKSGSSFDMASSLYDFDQALRVAIFDWIGVIEVAARSAISNIVAQNTGDIFWTTNPDMFADKERYKKTLTLIDHELKHTKEEFISHFKHKYNNPYPPAWMLVEILPIGVLNHIYGNISNNKLRKQIAARFALPVPIFNSWLTIVILTRNACCHHARIWNKENAISPIQIKKIKHPWINPLVAKNRIFYDLCIIKYFLDIILPGHKMKQRLIQLLDTYPTADPRAMGFPNDWRHEPLWTT